MHVLTWVALSAAPTPTPTMTVDPETVTPGVIGFVAVAVIAIAVVLLLVDMLRRVRRGRYRADVIEQLDAEEAARRAAEGADAPGEDEPRS